MTKFSLLNLKLDKNEDDKGYEPATIFKAVKSDNYGISVDKQVVFGLTLVSVDNDYGYDPLSENIDNIGIETIITYPKEGLVEGKNI